MRWLWKLLHLIGIHEWSYRHEYRTCCHPHCALHETKDWDGKWIDVIEFEMRGIELGRD